MKNIVKTLFTGLRKNRKCDTREFLFYRLQHHFIKHSEQAALRRAKVAREFVDQFALSSGDPQRILASSAS
jgi:hypothetical protein